MNCAHTFWWDSAFQTNRPSEALLLVKYDEPAVMNENIIHALKHIISVNIIVIVFLSSLLLFLLLPFLCIIIVIINNCLFNYVLRSCKKMARSACTCSTHFVFVIIEQQNSFSASPEISRGVAYNPDNSVPFLFESQQ